MYIRKLVSQICLHCGTVYERANKSTQKFCSHSCSAKNSWKTREKKNFQSDKFDRKGIKWSEERRVKMVEMFNSGKLPKGEKHHWWKGGKTPENQKIRNTKEYAQWRKQVYERDDYTCQDCNKRGGNLNADHIKPFSLFPELRFELSNGRTLCIECHKKTDTYAGKIYNYKTSLLTK